MTVPSKLCIFNTPGVCIPPEAKLLSVSLVGSVAKNNLEIAAAHQCIIQNCHLGGRREKPRVSVIKPEMALRDVIFGAGGTGFSSPQLEATSVPFDALHFNTDF